MLNLTHTAGNVRSMAVASQRLARGRMFKPMAAANRGPPAPRHTINVMTYNILAEKYTLGGWHSYCPPEHLRWESRRARILEEIESYGSDIICLQEVEAAVFSSELQPWLAQRGYTGHFLARQYGENVQGVPEGVALFYRTALFELQHLHAFTFSSVARTDPPAPLAPWLSASFDADDAAAAALLAAAPSTATATSERSPSSSNRTRSSSSNSNTGKASSSSNGRVGRAGNSEFWSVFTRRQEGAILALLRHRPSGRRLLAGVTHLFWNPAFPDVKAFQAAVLCQEAAAFLARHYGGGGGSGTPAAPQSVPVVLAGDFNSLNRKCVPDAFDPQLPRGPKGLVSGVYSLLTEGRLPPHHPDHPASRRRPGETGNADFRDVTLTASGLQLASAYCRAHGREPPLTTRTATFAGCLDYIFISPQHFEVASTLELPYDQRAAAGGSSDSTLTGWYDSVRDPLSDVAFTPIPDAVYPSDHLALAVQLRFKD